MELNNKLILLIAFTVWACCLAGAFACLLSVLHCSYNDKRTVKDEVEK
jgi:hypothetical protein